MIKRFVALCVVLCPALLVPFAVAQEEGPASIEIRGITDTNLPDLTLFVNVEDAFGVPVTGLTAEDFTISIDGAPARIVSVENVAQDNLPISVALAIDTSESMMGPPLEDAKGAALAFLDNLVPGDEVALLTFNTTTSVVHPFTTDLDAIRASVNNLQAGGRTALYDAAYGTAELAAGASNPRRFAVLLTDGNEYGRASTHTPDEGIALAVDQNIAFYVFGIGYGIDPSYLTALSGSTRGELYQSPDTSALVNAYDFLSRYLRTHYVITVAAEVEPDGSDHSVEVTTADQTASRAYTAPDRYPQLALDGLPEDPLAEPVTIRAEVEAPRGVGEVTLLVDGVPSEAAFAPAGENLVSAALELDPFMF